MLIKITEALKLAFLIVVGQQFKVTVKEGNRQEVTVKGFTIRNSSYLKLTFWKYLIFRKIFARKNNKIIESSGFFR